MPLVPGRIRVGIPAQPIVTDQRKAMARRIRSGQSWRMARLEALNRSPLCADPRKLHEGRIVPATEVHHMQRLELRPDLAYDQTNLMPVCSECHSVLSAEERR